MADSKRQQIIDAIIVRMQLIQIANGYETDLGSNVQDWETNYDDSELPALSVCDAVEIHTLVNNQPDAVQQKNVLPVQLRIFVKADTRAEELRKMFADLNKAIAVDAAWGNLAMWTIPVKTGMVIPETDFVIGGGAMEIEIHYLTNTFDSY